MNLMLKDVRLAFANGLWNKRSGNPDGTGKAKYSCTLILPKNHPQIAEINQTIDKVGRAKWLERAETILRGLRAADKVALHDSDKGTKAEMQGFAGNFYISARSDIKPSVFDHNRNEVSESSGIVYSGCYVVASVSLWAQDDPRYGKRVNAQIRGVQFLRDGDAFAAGTAASADEFGDVSDTGEGGGTAEEDPLG